MGYSGIFVGICSTSTEEGIAHVLNKAEAVVCVVDSETQLFKIMQIWDQVPCLKAVVKYFEPLDTNHKDVYMVSESKSCHEKALTPNLGFNKNV